MKTESEIFELLSERAKQAHANKKELVLLFVDKIKSEILNGKIDSLLDVLWSMESSDLRRLK